MNELKVAKNLRRGEKGITLIALVITIIVLLILAGVALSMLTGENSVLKRAVDAKESTERAELQEALQLAYIDLVGQDALGNSDNASLAGAVQAVQAQGYTNIKTVQTGGSSVTGISIKQGNTISLGKNATAEIEIEYAGGSSSESKYYAVIDGKYYEIRENAKVIEIASTATAVDGGGSSTQLTASSDNTSVVSIGDNAISGNKITLTGGSTANVPAKVTVTYGTHTATCQVTVVVTPTNEDIQQANANTTTFSTEYGKIDVIWLSGTGNTYSATPNAPELGGMTPVSWTKSGDTWTEDATAQSSYYSYTAGTGTADNTSSQWANAKNTTAAGDSYFVWIPRYAYRIIYYDKDYRTDSTAKITGYYDGYGMWNAEDGKVKYKLSDEDSSIETVDYGGNKYIVHPAFSDGSTKGYGNGQWSSPLKGIWVSKYEMSRNGATDSSAGSGYDGITFKSVPNVQSARSIAIGNMYTVAKSYDSAKESHMMKNSEWGAVAYLTHSQYGRNGYEIDKNNSSSYITGNGGGSTTSTSTVSGTANAYNTTTGAKASTTGNVYGVYDMSGGAWGYTAGYDKVSTSSYLTSSSAGLNMTKEAKDGDNYISTKDITAYNNGTSTSSGTKIYEVGKVGDATKEVYKGSGDYSWAPNSDYAYFVRSSIPFFLRGGYYYSRSPAGVFCSNIGDGNSSVLVSFRVVLCP